MSGGLPTGTKYLKWAPWNKEAEEERCPKCGSCDFFEGWTKEFKGKWVKVYRKICRECWNKWE